MPSIENIDEITKDMDIKITKGYYSNLQFIFRNNKATILHKGRDIKTFSLVWLSSFWASRDLATAVKMYLDSNNIPTTYVEQSTSKITDTMNFYTSGIPCPATYYTEGYKVLEHIKDIEKVCKYPMIMKDVKGCGGDNAALIKNRTDFLLRFDERDRSRKYIFQSFIPNDYDWGVLVSNGIVVSGERSYPKKGEFRNNVGATEVYSDVSEIPQNVKNIAINASNSLGLSWSRSDILVDRKTGLPYLLEVNRFPGITADSTEVFGANNFLNSCLEINNLKKHEKEIEIFNPVYELIAKV